MKKSIKCDCSGIMHIEKIEIMPDLFNEGYKCNKCGEVEFTEEQMRAALKKKEEAIKLMVVRKLGIVGGSLVLRIPASVKNKMNLKNGEEVRVTVEKNKIIIEPA